MNTKRSWYFLLLVFLVLTTLHWNHFDKELIGVHVWRQTETQTVTQNFYAEDFNILNPRVNERADGKGIRRMEFPLTQWCTAALYKVFGPHVIISRLLIFLFSLGAIAFMFYFLQHITPDVRFAWYGTWAFAFSPAFFYYAVTPMPDMFALFAGIAGLAFYVKFEKEKLSLWLYLACLAFSISALCKLPFVLYFALPLGTTFYRLLIRREAILLETLLVPILFIFPALLWYIAVIPSWGNHVLLGGIFENQISLSGMAQLAWYNIISTLPELLLNYGSVLFFVAGLYLAIKQFRNFAIHKYGILAVTVLLLLYVLFELNLIGRVHDYYFFPFLPLLFLLVAFGASHFLSQKNKYLRIFSIVLLLCLPLFAWLRMHHRWDEAKPGFNADWLLHRDALRAAVPDSSLCITGSDESGFIYLYYANKKGWNFRRDSLAVEQLEQMILKGADYFYSDSRLVDENPQISQHFRHLVTEQGSIRVYELIY